MKKLLLIVVAVMVIAAGLVVAGNHYKQYQNKQKAQATPVITLSDANKLVDQTKSADAAKYQSLGVKFNTAVAECQKGVVAYEKLTVTQQRQTASPVCPASQE